MSVILQWPTWLVAALCAAFSLAGCGGGDEEAQQAAADSLALADTFDVLQHQTVVDVVQSDRRFSLFAAALDSAGLIPQLEEPGSITLFAPTDDVFRPVVTPLFGAANRERLRDVLLYHAVRGSLSANQLRRGGRLTSLEGDTVGVVNNAGQILVGGIPVANASIRVGNGTVHVLKGVLNPPVETADSVRTAPAQ